MLPLHIPGTLVYARWPPQIHLREASWQRFRELQPPQYDFVEALAALPRCAISELLLRREADIRISGGLVRRTVRELRHFLNHPAYISA